MKNNNFSINISSNNNNINNDESSTNIGSKNKIDKSVIGNNNKFSSTKNNNTIHYYGTRKNNFLRNLVSELLISYLGKTKLRDAGIGSFVFGVITLCLLGNFVSPYLAFYFGITLIFIGCLFIYVLFHYNDTTCKKCNKEFAYYEYKNPDIRELKDSKRVIKTTTIHLKCKYCGYEDNRTNTVEYPESTSNFL